MTMTLAHPAAEDLGRFVEGTLDDAARAAVVEHIADCDECRIVVVDSSEFIEPAQAAGRPWWLAAAAVVLVATVATITYSKYHDPAAKVTDEYAQVKIRPIEGRLSGVPYTEWRVSRGGSDSNDETTDPLLAIMQGDAASAAELRGDDAKTLHARGIGLLLESKESVDESLAPLKAAAAKEPDNAHYQNDLATALIAAARNNDPGKLQLAVDACNRAIQVDPRSREALFNRALALESLHRTQEAITAYDLYLSVDPSSRWADEVRRRLDYLRSSLLPPA
ncbi:MAG TPA: zf-HC2 domain-containing protein [Thermoanaerobaculia bacterium]|jgi:tetratricopeptide (TPR) repeat protein|nr:zf-HC2 domain-containing protein [Thermoanaerobaculia bacterium]